MSDAIKDKQAIDESSPGGAPGQVQCPSAETTPGTVAG